MRRCRPLLGTFVEVECDRLEQVIEAVTAGAGMVLVDNMTPDELRAAVAEVAGRVPVEVSRELSAHLRSPESRLIVVPGGHHRSIQHDRELQAVSLRFIERALGG